MGWIWQHTNAVRDAVRGRRGGQITQIFWLLWLFAHTGLYNLNRRIYYFGSTYPLKIIINQ